MKNGDMPAMPVRDADNEILRLAHYPVYANGEFATGLTKREEFAKAAMQGLLAGGYCIDDAHNRLTDVPAEALHLADAILAELERTKSS